MAAGLVTLRSGGRIAVRSAGSEPAETIDPVAVEAMAELGVDIREQADPGRDRPSRPGTRRRAPAVTTPLARCLVAEAFGTFALVFAGAGAIMVDAKTHQLGHIGVAITFGLVVMAMIYAIEHISGAHFNAAVTLAFVLTRHFPLRRAVAYWGAQLAGALTAALVLRGSLGNIADVGARSRPARRRSRSSGSS